MRRLVREPRPPTELSLFCRLWKKHRDITGRPLCVAFLEKSWGNQYKTIQAAIACGDLDWVLRKMIEEQWSKKRRAVVLTAWYDYNYNFANREADAGKESKT